MQWTASTGETGTAAVDAVGLVTVVKVRILPETATVLTLLRSR
jgi:hypothetical protein